MIQESMPEIPHGTPAKDTSLDLPIVHRSQIESGELSPQLSLNILGRALDPGLPTENQGRSVLRPRESNHFGEHSLKVYPVNQIRVCNGVIDRETLFISVF